MLLVTSYVRHLGAPPGLTNSEGKRHDLTGWGVLLGILVVAAIVVAGIVLIIQL